MIQFLIFRIILYQEITFFPHVICYILVIILSRSVIATLLFLRVFLKCGYVTTHTQTMMMAHNVIKFANVVENRGGLFFIYLVIANYSNIC